jgi:hypothetical protein
MNVIIEWNDVFLETIRKIGGGPTPIARAGAMLQVAMFNTINALSGNLYSPYPSNLQLKPDPGTSPEIAAVYAAHRILSRIYVNLTMTFNTALDTSLQRLNVVKMSDADTKGKTFGQAVADSILTLRQNDGSDQPPLYKPGNQPGDWRPTGSGDAVAPQWPDVTPFVMTSGSQFRPPFPGNYANTIDLLRSPEYAAQFNEVKLLGAANSPVRTAEEAIIAFFWANDVDGTYKPPGHLFRITQIVAQQRNLSLLETARLFALVGLVMGDAAIVAWDAKYRLPINLWRPETAIRLADQDGNLLTEADPNWQPLSINPAGQRFSPAFPAYVSGHSTFGAAHAGIMRNFFGTDNVTFTADTDDPKAEGIKRTYNSFSSAALENGRSRIYLGVHFQWDADHGFWSGTQLADFVYAKVLQRV